MLKIAAIIFQVFFIASAVKLCSKRNYSYEGIIVIAMQMTILVRIILS